ncbi:MAG: type II secretion system GspH family protein [Firmicutes bacterium]|nr:type II secretion system GspH family protein [Bacillota bacterium]
MNKKGMTLIEVLASLVIFGLLISLLATVISLINYASTRIEINSMANTQGLYLDREIKDHIQDFGPTEYMTCGSNCVIFQKAFIYEFDPNLEDIVLTVYNPALTHKIEISDGQILIDDVPLQIEYFTLGSGTQIELIENLSQAYFVLTIELVADSGKVYTFTTSYSFAILAVPTP